MLYNKSLLYASNIYLREIQWRFFYVLFSLFLAFCTTLYFIDSFLLFETYPLVKIEHKKFIATHITELFNSIIQFCFFVSYVSSFPVFSYHTYKFFSPSFYSYQLQIIKFYIVMVCSIWVFSSFLTYKIMLPTLFSFFIQWETQLIDSLFLLKLEARIQDYLTWVNRIYNLVNVFIQFFCYLLTLLFTLCNTNVSFHFFKLYRKHFIFLVLLFLYILLPPDFPLQIFIVIIVSILSECIFFILCFRLKSLKFLVAQ
jgi:sec-independent protein translocase protein TatC